MRSLATLSHTKSCQFRRRSRKSSVVRLFVRGRCRQLLEARFSRRRDGACRKEKMQQKKKTHDMAARVLLPTFPPPSTSSCLASCNRVKLVRMLDFFTTRCNEHSSGYVVTRRMRTSSNVREGTVASVERRAPWPSP